MTKNKLLKILSFFIFPAIVFLFDLIFNNFVFNAYEVFPWIDIPMHFIGGISVGYMFVLFFRFFEEEDLIKIKNKFVFVLIVVCAVSMIAVLWEFWEFFMEMFFNLDWALGYEDTLLDLFMGICGGFFVGVFSKV